MKHMSLKEIAAACGGTYFGSSDAAVREVGSVVIDSQSRTGQPVHRDKRRSRGRTYFYPAGNEKRRTVCSVRT